MMKEIKREELYLQESDDYNKFIQKEFKLFNIFNLMYDYRNTFCKKDYYIFIFTFNYSRSFLEDKKILNTFLFAMDIKFKHKNIFHYPIIGKIVDR